MWRSLLLSLVLVFSIGVTGAGASPLAERIAHYPDWQTQPSVQAAKGDLVYPDWFEGTWAVTTTLVDQVAPLAPEIITPGFAGNQQYLQKPIPFQARFVASQAKRSLGGLIGVADRKPQIIADRAFNGLSLSRAYLDERSTEPSRSQVMAVKVDPRNPNRQITVLRGDRQLVSTVTARATESPNSAEFITSEVFQQEFRGAPQIYFNTVETTTDYTLHPGESPTITASQITAIYLSPQDPDFFAAGDRPVALYRYTMEFFASDAESSIQ